MFKSNPTGAAITARALAAKKRKEMDAAAEVPTQPRPDRPWPLRSLQPNLTFTPASEGRLGILQRTSLHRKAAT